MARTEVTGTQIKDASVSLTVDVTGILPVANGGTGSNTIPLNNVLLGNGTGALQSVAPGTAGQVLRSNGTTWSSSALSASDVPTLNQNTTGSAASLSATLPIATGGTGQTTAAAAITALTGTQTAGRYLRSDGTNATLSAIQAADVPTLNQNTTGTAATLTTGRTIQTDLAATTAATFNGSTNITPGVTGILAVANGGTGSASLVTAATASSVAARDANANLTADNFINTVESTATAAGTTALTIASGGVQVFTGTTTQTVTLPTTSVTAGMSWTVINQSTGAVTVNASGGTTVATLAGSTTGVFTAVAATPTTNAQWTAQVFGNGDSLTTLADLTLAGTDGKTLTVNNSLTLAGTDATTMTFPSTNATLARTDAAQTFTGVQTMTSPALTTPAITGAITGTYSFGGTPTWPTFNQNTTGTASNVTGTVAVANGGTGATTLTGLIKGTGTTAMVAATAGTDYVAPGGALGTPSSGTLTNCTGLPLAGLAAAAYATANTASTLVQRDASGNFTAGTVTAALTGNATTATTLQTARTINGVSFNGSANITVADSTKEPTITAGTTAQYWRGDKSWQTLNATAVGLGNVSNVAASATATASTVAQRDANNNLLADNFIPTYTSTATAAGTTTLDVTATQIQVFTGTTTQTVKLPTTSILAGQSYTIVNQSTGALAVQSSGANAITSLAAGTTGVFTAVVSTPTTDAHWVGTALTAGKIFKATADLTLSGTDGNVYTFPATPTTDTVVTLGATQTLTAKTLTAPIIDTINLGDEVTRGPILTLGAITGGSGYTDGTYTSVALTGGSGTYATADITVAGGIVTAVTLKVPGARYKAADVLSAATATIGTLGTGFSIPVATVRTVTMSLYNATPPRIRFTNTNTAVAAGTEYGTLLFASNDATPGANGDKVRVTATAEATSGGGNLQIWTAANAAEPTLAAAIMGDNTFRVYNSAGTFYHSLASGATANRAVTLPDAAGTLALTANKLNVFAATTSAELAGVISDETGSGLLVFGTSPTLTTPALSGTVTGTYTLGGTPTFPSTVVLTTATQTLSGKTLQVADGLLVTHTTNGNLLGFGSVASGDSYIEIANNISGTAPRVSAVGTAGTIPLSLGSKGTGTVFFRANNVANSFAVTSAASSGNVNYLQVNQVASGSTPSFSVAGSFDTDVSINLVPKGAGTVQAGGVEVVTLSGTQTLTSKTLTNPKIGQINDTNGNTAGWFGGTASAVNWLQLGNSIAGAKPLLRSQGSDTNVGLSICPKGTGTVVLLDGAFQFVLEAAGVTSAVNSLLVANAVAGADPYLQAVGSDAAVSLNLRTKSTGVVKANGVEVVTISGTQTLSAKTLTSPKINQINDSNGNLNIAIGAVASAVNYFQVNNSATGNGVNLYALGSDTNIDLNLLSKGTGQVFANSKPVLTAKPRVNTTASSATPSINCDTTDQYNITALAVAITGVTITGTPGDGQKLMIRIKDNATSRAITWGASFSASGNTPLLAATIASKTHLMTFVYDSVVAKWVCMACDDVGY